MSIGPQNPVGGLSGREDRIDPTGILEGPAPAQYEAPSDEEQKLVTHLTTMFDQAERQRSAQDADWEFNRQMLLGNQLLVKRPYDPSVLRAIANDDSGRRYSQDNVLRNTSRAFVGKAIKIIPGIDVQPQTADRDDILGAEIRKSYLDWWFEQVDARKVYKRLYEDIPAFGTGIFEIYWDRDAGSDMFWCATCDHVSTEGQDGDMCPLCAMQAMMQLQQMRMGQIPPQQFPPQGQLRKVRSGMTGLRRLEPGEFYPEPGVTEISDMQYCFTRRALPVAKIRMLCPEKGMLVEEEPGLYRDKWVTYNGSLVNARVQTDIINGYANLTIYHEMPSLMHPEGRIIYMCNDRILRQGPNPYVKRFGQLPFYAFRGERIPGLFWGEPLLTQQVHLQKEYNHLLTQLREHRELTLNPKVYAQAGSGVKAGRMDTSAGEVVYIRPRYKYPEVSRMPSLPAYVSQEVQRFPSLMREKAFLTDYDVGANTMDQSGRSMALLAAQSSELMGPLMVENIPEWLKMAKHVLILAEELDPPERRWLVNGRDRFLEHAWSQISSRNGWDVRMADEDSLSKNPTLRRQEALELLQAGVYTDSSTGQPDMRRFMRDAGLKQPGAGVDSTLSEHTHASLIPEKIMRGQMVVPQLFDDANIHALELLKWLRGKGRTAAPHIRNAVLQLWMQYAFAAAPAMDMSSYMPNPGMMQAAGKGVQAQQPGGVGAGPQTQAQGMGPGRLPSGQQGAANTVQNADHSAERAARGNQPHEG